MASWKDSARSVGASSGASVHLSSEYDMFLFLSIRKLPEEDNDEEFSGEHAGSSAAGRMVVPPIDAMPFVTDSKSLAYELHWMLESSLVENCSVVMDDDDNRMSVGTPLSVCCFEGGDDAAPSSLTGTRTSPTRMLLLVIVGFCLLVSFVGRFVLQNFVGPSIHGAAKFFFIRILPTKVLEVCLLGRKSSSLHCHFSLSAVREGNEK